MNRLCVLDVYGTIHRDTLAGTPGVLALTVRPTSEEDCLTTKELETFQDAAQVAVAALKSQYEMSVLPEEPHCVIQGHVTPDFALRLIGAICLEANPKAIPDPKRHVVFGIGEVEDRQPYPLALLSEQ